LDVLVIDGPPAFDVAHKFARLGALNLISRLGQDFVVIVDDTERAGEAMLSAMIQDQLSTLNIGFRRKDIRGAQCQTIFAGGAFAGAADF
jgi:hypothetical protein